MNYKIEPTEADLQRMDELQELHEMLEAQQAENEKVQATPTADDGTKKEKLTAEQRLAKAQLKAQRLKEKIKKQKDAEKIIIGALVINEIKDKKEPRVAAWLMRLINEKARDIDKSRLKDLTPEIETIANA